MRICISSTGTELNDLMDPRFARCRYFIVFDEVSGLYEAVENSAGLH